MRAFREGVEIIHRMWTEDKPTFNGEYYRIDEPINEPKSARPGRKIPLWIGGGGEQVTLKLVAKYGDATNVGIEDAEVIRHKFDVLRGHCEAVGRDYDEIVHSTEYYVYPVQPGADPVAVTARLRETMGNMSYEDFAKAHHVGTVDDLAELVRPGRRSGLRHRLHPWPGL